MHKYKLTSLALSLIVASFLAAEITSGRAHAENTQAGSTEGRLLQLLEKSGYKYTKVSDGVWEVPATGENIKNFGIRLATADEIVLALVKLADRKDLIIKEAFLLKMLELNHNFDSAKMALSEEMLYVRIDIHARLLDEEELKYLIEQIANATDEAYPHIKGFIAGAK